MSPILTVLDKGWPFAATVLSGVFAFGSLHSDVADLKSAQAARGDDHDRIVRIEQSQSDMRTDLADIKRSLRNIEQNR